MERGFTLIEAMIVVSVLAIMTSFLVLYNRTGELQIKILTEEASFIDTVLRARNQALGVLNLGDGAQVVCGYGVVVSNDSYFIYRDLAVDCDASDHGYSGESSGETIDGSLVRLPETLNFKTTVADILFSPPVPDVFFDGLPAIDERLITLADKLGQAEKIIKINNAGQISN